MRSRPVGRNTEPGHTAFVSDLFSTRFPCCVCGDPWTLESFDYVEIRVQGTSGARQWLGAHSTCLSRVFTVQVEIGGDKD